MQKYKLIVQNYKPTVRKYKPTVQKNRGRQTPKADICGNSSNATFGRICGEVMAEELFIAFRVVGVAQPAGSKNSYVPLHQTLKLPYYRGGVRNAAAVPVSSGASHATRRSL